jgi:hypothetical protein
VEQKQFNNHLTERLIELAEKNNYVFDPDDFNFVAIRDRIRCYYKSYVQMARKRGLELPSDKARKEKQQKLEEARRLQEAVAKKGEVDVEKEKEEEEAKEDEKVAEEEEDEKEEDGAEKKKQDEEKENEPNSKEGS